MAYKMFLNATVLALLLVIFTGAYAHQEPDSISFKTQERMQEARTDTTVVNKLTPEKKEPRGNFWLENVSYILLSIAAVVDVIWFLIWYSDTQPLRKKKNLRNHVRDILNNLYVSKEMAEKNLDEATLKKKHREEWKSFRRYHKASSVLLRKIPLLKQLGYEQFEHLNMLMKRFEPFTMDIIKSQSFIDRMNLRTSLESVQRYLDDSIRKELEERPKKT